jgi:hypothetical protein
MAGTVGGRLAAAIVVLSLGAAACGYDRSNGTGPGYGDSAAAVRAEPQVTLASGDLTQALADFRHALGDVANRTAGEQPNGRREVNWDGVPSAITNTDTLPADFFNRVVPRGQVYTSEGAGFRVSDNALADLNPSYASQFGAFSPAKIFIARGNRAMTVHFFVAGSTTPAVVSGFGVVFSDVDRERSTSLAFYDAKGRLLKVVSAPVRSDAAGFSFVGVNFNAAIVARVRIIAGQAAITGASNDISAGGESDLVAMDDFISGEPHAIH